jgi:hypothetical protein
MMDSTPKVIRNWDMAIFFIVQNVSSYPTTIILLYFSQIKCIKKGRGAGMVQEPSPAVSQTRLAQVWDWQWELSSLGSKTQRVGWAFAHSAKDREID